MNNTPLERTAAETTYNLRNRTNIWLVPVRCSIFKTQHSNFECRISNIKLNPTFKSNVEYRISNSISHSNFECRISNIKLNPTFKSNVEYRISNSIQHSNRMSNIEYQTKSNIQIECRISNIKLNPTFKSNVEYRISNQFLIAAQWLFLPCGMYYFRVLSILKLHATIVLYLCSL